MTNENKPANTSTKGRNMLKTVEEVKQLVLWAKQNGLKKLKIDTIEFEFSDLILAASLPDGTSEQSDQPSRDKLTGAIPEMTDEELLFMSAR